MQAIFTDRLILRKWQEEDIEPFTALNQDPRVMEFFPSILTEEEVKTFVTKISKDIENNGFGLFACVLQETQELIGFVGLNKPNFDAHFIPCVEIGWRLAFDHWGKGYATEAAEATLKLGFETYALPEIVAFAVSQNMRSRRVMEKLGMKHDKAGDFQHPMLPINHPLSQHVLYRISVVEYKNRFCYV